MEDYEIRDVMFREQTPNISVRFRYEITEQSHVLAVEARNHGSAYAEYVAVFLDVPTAILLNTENKLSLTDGGRYYRHRLTNLNQDYADEQFRANFPLLRSMAMYWKIPLRDDFELPIAGKQTLKWKLYADNALPKEGRTAVSEIEVVDLRKKG
jgi:hypothetical protein